MSLEQDVAKFLTNVQRADRIVNGTNAEVVNTDAGPVPSFANIIKRLMLVGAKRYDLKSQIDGDLNYDAGTLAQVEKDPVAANNGVYVKAGAANQGNWSFLYQSAFTTLSAQAARSAIDVASILAGFTPPMIANFEYRSGYAPCWVTLANPSSRWTITEAPASYKVDVIAVPQPWPVGVKLPYDLVPGDTIDLECKITAGTIDGTVGPFIGTDPTAAGDISNAAIMYHWRNAAAGAGFYGQGYTGTGGIIAGYETVPQAGSTAPSVPFAVNDLLRIKAQVRGDRSLVLELFVNGASKLKVTAPGILPPGAVMVGVLAPMNGSATITRIERTRFSGQTVYVDSTVASSGNGTLHAPVKTLEEAQAIALSRRFPVLDIEILSDEVRGAIVADDRVFKRYRIRGKGGSQSRIISADRNPVDWTLLSGTTRVYLRPNKNTAGAANTTQSGTVYLIDVETKPYPWYSLPDSMLPYFTGAPADLETQAAGGRRVTGGTLYVRLPDGIGPNPATVPMEVNTSAATLYCIGSPELEVENIIFSRGGNYSFYGDRATGVFRNCGFEWSESNGTEDAAGSFTYENCQWDCIYNDAAARTFPANYTDSPAVLPASIYDGGRISRTIVGDGISNHGRDLTGRARMRVHNMLIEDCGKDGIVPASCDAEVSNCYIRRCANAQIEVISGNQATLPSGMFSNVVVDSCTLDPEGLGLYGLMAGGYAGGHHVVRVNRTHIGVPVNGEVWGRVNPVSGRTSTPADFSTILTACTTARPNPVMSDGGQVQLVVAASYPMSGQAA